MKTSALPWRQVAAAVGGLARGRCTAVNNDDADVSGEVFREAETSSLYSNSSAPEVAQCRISTSGRVPPQRTLECSTYSRVSCPPPPPSSSSYKSGITLDVDAVVLSIL